MKNTPFSSRANQILNIITILVLIGNTSWAQKNTYSKKINNSYQATSNDALTLINKFGAVSINNWESNEILVEVDIKIWANNETAAKAIFEKIVIDEKRKEQEIFYETKIIKKHKSKGKLDFEINYTVNMPSYISLNLTNRFGTTYVGDLDAPVMLNVAYGNLTAKRLSHKYTNIKVSYGNAVIEEIRQGNVKTSYCNDVKIGKVGTISIEDRNGKLEIDEANIVNAKSTYSAFSIAKLHESLKLSSKFGNVEINEIQENIKNIDVDIAYGDLNLDLKQVTNFDFEVDMEYGEFEPGSMSLNYQSQSEKLKSKKYLGKRGKGGSMIKIQSAYCGVSF